MRDGMVPGGRIAIMGPNFRYCSKEYFDWPITTSILTHVAIAEHLYAAGFEPQRVIPRYLPYSFRGSCPPRRASPASTCAPRLPGSCSASSSCVIGQR